MLFGPPGLGKTTLANIIAKEMGVNLRQTSGPVLEKTGDLAALLSNLEAMMFYLLMKFIDYLQLLRRFFIQQWKIIV